MMRGAAFLLLAWSAIASAHDLALDIELLRPEIAVSAAYGPGEPAAGATVNVAASTAPDVVSITGETDADGVFVFTPPAEGEWLIRIDDGYGHMASRPVTVDWAAPPQTPVESFSLWTRAGAGLAVIFGATLFFMRARRPKTAL